MMSSGDNLNIDLEVQRVISCWVCSIKWGIQQTIAMCRSDFAHFK